MVHMLDAPREVVWQAFTNPKLAARWYDGRGFANPVCEMDVRPGGHWHHVMRTPDGGEHPLHFIFVEVLKPERLVARFTSIGERDLAVSWGFAAVLREGIGRMRELLATLQG